MKLNTYQEVEAALLLEGVDFSKYPIREADGSLRPRNIIVDYEQRVLGMRAPFKAFWAKAQKHIREGTNPRWSGLLRAWGLYSGYDPVDFNLLSQFVGGVYKREIKELPCEEAHEAKNVASNSLFVPTWDVPGRITGGYLLSETRLSYMHFNIRPGGNREYYNAGMAFLGQLRPDNLRVFAMNDIQTALQLHVKYARTNPLTFNKVPLQLVTYTPEVRYSWRVLSRFGRETIFWNRGPWNEDMLAVANRCDVASLASEPRWVPMPPKLVSRQLCGYMPSEVIAAMYSSSRGSPYLEALANFLVKAQPEERARLARQLYIDGFSSEKRKQMLALIPDNKREMIAPYFQEVHGSREIQSPNEKCVLENGVLVRKAYKKEGDTFLSAVIAEFQTRTFYVDTEEEWLTGILRSGKDTVPFTERRSVLERNYKEWAEKTLMAAGFTPGAINDKAKPKPIVSSFLRLSNPPISRATSRVGWDAKIEAFSFPHFHVKPGCVVKKEAELPSGFLGPASNLKPPLGISSEVLQRLTEPNDTSAGFMAIFTAFLHNVLSGYRNWRVSPIGIVTPSEGHPLFNWWVQAFGLLEMEVDHKAGIKDMLAAAERHDIPLAVTAMADGTSLAKWLHSGERANIITTIPELAGKLLLLNNTVTLVTPPCAILDPSQLQQAERLLTGYLCWLLKELPSFGEGSNTYLSTARTLDKWLSLATGDPVNVATEALHKYVREPAGRGHYGPRLVEVLEYLLEKGVIHASIAADKQAAIIKGADAVTIQFTRVDQVLAALNCPPLPRGNISSLLVESAPYLGGDASSCNIPIKLYRKWQNVA